MVRTVTVEEASYYVGPVLRDQGHPQIRSLGFKLVSLSESFLLDNQSELWHKTWRTSCKDRRVYELCAQGPEERLRPHGQSTP